MRIALVSTKNAPGCTTIACAVGATWPEGRSVVLAECDPSGNDVAARFAVRPEPGMASFVLAVRHDVPLDEALAENSQHLPGGLPVLLGPCGAEAAAAVDTELQGVVWGPVEGDLVFDCGRFLPGAPGQQSLLAAVDEVILVLRPDAPSVVQGRAVAERLRRLRGASCSEPLAIVCHDGPFAAPDVADAVGLELLGCMPTDHAAAAALRGEPTQVRGLHRLPLMRTAAFVGLQLCQRQPEKLRHAS